MGTGLTKPDRRGRNGVWAGLGAAAVALCSCTSGASPAVPGSLDLGGGGSGSAAPGAGSSTPGNQGASAAAGAVAGSDSSAGTVGAAAGAGGPVSGTAAGVGSSSGPGAAGAGPARASTAASGCPNPMPVLTVGHYYAYPPAGGIGGGSYAGAVILDGSKAAQEVIDYVNTHGGAGCHRLAQVGFGQQDGVDNQSTDDQAACTKFTRDVHVPVVLNVTTTTPNFYACLANAGVPEVESNYGNPDEAAYRQYADYVYSVEAAQDRVGKTLAWELNRDGYFHAGGGVYGLLYEDHPWFKASADAFVAEARSFGVKIAAADAICNPATSANPLSPCDQSQLQAETVKFRSLGINHVALLGITVVSWIQSASNQGYFPTLGITSQADPDLIGLNAPNPRSLQGAVGVGYFPGLDVQPGQDVQPTAGHNLCHQILFGGNNPPDAVAEAQGDGECDAVFLLKAILDKDHGNTSPAAMTAALYSLGTSYSPASTFGDEYQPGRNDGGSAYHPLVFQNGCSCFQYLNVQEPFQS